MLIRTKKHSHNSFSTNGNLQINKKSISLYETVLLIHYYMDTFISGISGKTFSESEKVKGSNIRESVYNLIIKEHPDFTREQCISTHELNIYKEKYIEFFVKKQLGELSEIEKKVVDSMKKKSTITDKLDDEEPQLSFGQKVADKVATFGGSWTFIISFITFLTLWIIINIFWITSKPFDPYPFILLNLILSTIAAIQAPVIMMSQNRQEEKDRDRAKKDYMINLKSELEIRMLHEKIDQIINAQQQEIANTQKIQAEILDKINQQENKHNG